MTDDLNPSARHEKIDGCAADNMIIEIYRTIPRMQAQLEHICERVDTTAKKLDERMDGLEGKIDDLTSWKYRILGGVATLAFLLAGFKLVSEQVHVSIGSNPNAPSGATL